MKLALVTGASSGLGKALCQALSAQNIPLILVARNEHALKNLALELPFPCRNPSRRSVRHPRNAKDSSISSNRDSLILSSTTPASAFTAMR